MSFDPVCWSITGASTPAAMGRMLANISSQNTQGINLPGDLKVTQLGSPGAGVQIATGGAILRNAQAAGESYIGKASSVTTVPIAPTGGSARSDLIVAYVIDPDFAPWSPYTTPSQILNGPYFQPGVLSGVANTTTLASQIVSYSAMALARVDIPAGISVITNAMITDLRALARPRTQIYSTVQTQGSTTHLPYSQATAINWPPNSWSVAIPSWATQATARIDITQIQCLGPTGSDASCVVQLGTLQGSVSTLDFNAPSTLAAGDAVGIPLSTAATFSGPSFLALAGTTVVMQPMAFRIQSGHTDDVQAQPGRTQVIFTIQFDEVVT